MKIALFGGRFDPPHIGHYLVATQILEKRPDIKEVWFVPAYKHQWKPIIANGKDRINMLSAFADSRIKILDIEINKKGISYTIDTIQEIKKSFNHTLYWIVGSDILSEFTRWERAEELINLTTFLVFPRDPLLPPKTLPNGFETVLGHDLITTNLSSTIIRNRVKKNLPITCLVPKEVEDYIVKHKLYT
ncbi:MAG: nicotinate (nicotinamide) nucleotide adenylyltransferase [Candidatus Levyibacteriota bacterium]|nr:MAG: nicotinate (nicotinamide) nucleotide adenylyltransferase [Candidatus Levybacteria bacterium]